MKVKNSYLKLMLWTLSGAAIGAVLGAGSIMFAKRGLYPWQNCCMRERCGLPYGFS